jgi:ATP-binding cassette subfamily F protein 3
LWVVADRAVTTFDGDLDDYRRMVLSARGMRTSARDRSPPGRDNRSDKPERARGEKRMPLTRRIAEAEAEIARLRKLLK